MIKNDSKVILNKNITISSNILQNKIGHNDKINDNINLPTEKENITDNKPLNNDQEIKIKINLNSIKESKNTRNNDNIQNLGVNQTNSNVNTNIINKNYSKKVDDVYLEALVQKEEKIFDLHKQYQELKKERIKSEHDLKYLSNRMNLLEHENKKKEIRVKRIEFNNSKINKNKSLIMENKSIVKSLSSLKKTQLNNKLLKVNYIKQTEEYTLKNWRSEVIIKKHNEKQILKKEVSRLKKKREKIEKKDMHLKKSIVEKVNYVRNCTLKNKLLKDNNVRELKIMELKEKILKENELRNNLNKKIEEVETKENKFIKSKTIEGKDFDKFSKIRNLSASKNEHLS